MKNTTKTIAVVLALFLVAALFVGAASARDVSGSSGDAFVYETITVDSLTGTHVLAKVSGDATPVVLNTITSDASGNFNLLEAAVGTYTGVYYVDYDAVEKKGLNGTINIWYPEMTLKAYLKTGYDTIDGKTITKDTKFRFVLEAPKVGPATSTSTGGLNPLVQVMFTTPVGGKTIEFGGTSFNDIQFNGKVQNETAQVSPGTDANAGTYVAQAEFYATDVNPIPFIGIPDKYKKSNTVSFTVQSTSLTLTANKDSVVRSNPFTVTIQGESQTLYFIYLDGASSGDINPTLQPDQNGMKSWTQSATKNSEPLVKDATEENIKGTFGYFTTDASGKRTVQYNTKASTEDKTYTVKVHLMVGTTEGTEVSLQTYDSVKVKVEKGAVTITASGDRSYYIGEEIKLTGTNTDSTKVFLFITGPNLVNDGVQLSMVAQKSSENAIARLNSNPESVKTDNTWEYKWDTSNCGLDTGAYTIYATSMLTNGKSSTEANVTTDNPTQGTYIDGKPANTKWAVKLSDSEYATVSVNLKQPFLSAIPSGTTVAKGDKIYIRGTAEGDPNNLRLYIFGPNFFEDYSVTVEDDGSYEKKIDIPDSMSSNQYFVVIQHPMYNGKFDADLGGEKGSRYFYVPNTGSTGNQASFIVEGTNKLQGSNAADALTKMIDNANIDDIYTKLTFTVQEAWIKINNPGDQAVGTTFTITGTTNLAVDDQILIEVVSSSFNAIDKTSTSTTSGFSQTTKVVAGDGTDNAWSIDVDSTNFKLDEYTIKASGIEADVTTTTNFNLVEKVNPTVTPTATVTGQPTTTATTAVPTDAPKTPGFGAFIALAGLGAVALLVLRRN